MKDFVHLTRTQIKVLLTLFKYEKLTLSRLCALCCDNAKHMNSQLEKLEQLKPIVVKRIGRCKIVRITDRGREIAKLLAALESLIKR